MRECMHSCVSSSVCFVRWEALTAMFSPAPQNGWTPLHRASLNGHEEVVEALLAKGADVEAREKVSIARLRPPFISLTREHCTWRSTFKGFKTALRLRSLSAITNMRLGQSGSGPQRDTVHNKSLQ
jgi:hypothetical protein